MKYSEAYELTTNSLTDMARSRVSIAQAIGSMGLSLDELTTDLAGLILRGLQREPNDADKEKAVWAQMIMVAYVQGIMIGRAMEANNDS